MARRFGNGILSRTETEQLVPTTADVVVAYTQSDVDALVVNMNPRQKAIFFENHIAIRENINHASISGPFETGWGYTEFDGAGFSGRVGLPELPGQVTNIGKQK
jgi:hypothetical protein